MAKNGNRDNRYTRVRDLKKRSGSSTAGKEKGDACHKNPLKTRLAKDSRFYRTSRGGDYERACIMSDTLNDVKNSIYK